MRDSDSDAEHSDSTLTKTTREVSVAGVSDTLAEVLGLQLPLQEGSIRLAEDIDFKLRKHGNAQLFIAAENGEAGSIKLLICCGADVNHLNKGGQRAVDIVWVNVDADDYESRIKNYDCMLLLLQAGSLFPEDFDVNYVLQSEDAPDELKSFVQERNDLYNWIVNSKVQEISEFAVAHDISSFLHFSNESPVHIAAELGNENVLAALFTKPSPALPGTINMSESEGKLLNQVNGKGDTPLLTASRAGNQGNVEFLVRSGARVGFRNKVGETAVDLAWSNQHYGVVLSLLGADSHYPKGFGIQHISASRGGSTELKEFVEGRDNLHKCIEDGHLDDVTSYINNIRNPSSTLYLSSKGDSALFTSIKNNQNLQLTIYTYLKNKGLCFRSSEEEEILQGLDDDQKDEIKQAMIHHCPEVVDAHISFLVSKSKTSVLHKNFKSKVEEIYRKLDSIPEVSLMMKVTQYNDFVEILFDFDTDHVTPMYPHHGSTTKGITDYRDGRIFVGFKMDSPSDESERLATLAHELTHLAMQITYQNNCNPYGKNDTPKESMFKEIIEEMKTAKGVDNIIERVFLPQRDKEGWPSELIVRVPHILVKYGIVKGKRILRKQARKLYSYFNDYVMDDCEKTIEENYLIKPRNYVRRINQSLGVINDIEKANVSFENTKLPEGFFNTSHNILLVKTESTWLSCICIYQALQEMPRNVSQNSYIFLRFDQFENVQDDVRYTFKSQACNIIIVECRSSLEENTVRNMLQMLAVIFSAHKKVVFVVTEGDDARLIQDTICNEKLFPKFAETCDTSFTLADLTVESQKNILCNRVLFQGENVMLKDVLDQRSYNCIDSKLLSKLVNKEIICFGNELNDLGDMQQYYIKRSLIARDFSIGTLNKEESHNLFFISGLERELIPAHKNVFMSTEKSKTSEEIQFESICTNNPTSNVHWLRHDSGKLLWRRTHGSVYELMKHRRSNSVLIHSEAEMLFPDVHKKVIIISAVAGMGKSVVLTHLAQEIKKTFPGIWVLRIDLNIYTDKLRKLKTILVNLNGSSRDRFEECAVTFLVDEMLTFKTMSEKKLLELSLRTNNKAVLLFDGFDEISPAYNMVVIHLLRGLKNYGVRQLIVTTRPVMEEMLEEELNTLSFGLEPFSANNQKEFLVKFWKSRFCSKDNNQIMMESIEYYADALLQKLSLSIICKGASFVEIPLQIKMIAEIFPETLEMNIESDKHIFSVEKLTFLEKCDLTDLYDRFICKKYDIYKAEKAKLETLSAQEMATKYRDIFIINHQHLAVMYLLPEEIYRLLLSEKQLLSLQTLISEINEGKEKTGIITKTCREGNTVLPQFIHRTFAEYFLANFLCNKMNEIITQEFQELILQFILYDYSYSGIRVFLNCLFAAKHVEINIIENYGSAIHKLFPSSIWYDETRGTALNIAAIEGNDKILEFIVISLERHPDTLVAVVNARGALHKVSLHNAAVTCSSEVLELLVTCGADVNAKDFKGRTPLHIAATTGNLEALRSLLAHGAHVNAQDDKRKSALHRAASKGRTNIIMSLIDNGADVNLANHLEYSALFSAAERHHFDAMKLLIENRAQITSNGLFAICGRKFSEVGEEIEWLLKKISSDVIADVVKEVIVGAITKQWYGLPTFLIEFMKTELPEVVLKGVDSETVHTCAVSGKWKLVDEFIKLGIKEENCGSSNRKTLLHYAAFQGRLDVVSTLIKLMKDGVISMDIAQIDENGFTALELAASFGGKELVQFLWHEMENVSGTAGIDPGRVLIQSASFGNLELLKWLLDEKHAEVGAIDETGRNSLHYAAARNTCETVEFLLTRGAEVNSADNKGWTPLHHASNSCGDYVLSWLKGREAGVDVTEVFGTPYGCGDQINGFLLRVDETYENPVLRFLECKTGSDCTPKENNMCRIAITDAACDTVSLLVRWNAEVNARNDRALAPMHLAACRGIVDVMRRLSEGGADLNCRSQQGRTPLHFAAMHSHRAAVEWLASMKVDYTRDVAGLTPFSISEDAVILQCLRRNYAREMRHRSDKSIKNLSEYVRQHEDSQ